MLASLVQIKLYKVDNKGYGDSIQQTQKTSRDGFGLSMAGRETDRAIFSP
jgi:hypothetical protein